MLQPLPTFQGHIYRPSRDTLPTFQGHFTDLPGTLTALNPVLALAFLAGNLITLFNFKNNNYARNRITNQRMLLLLFVCFDGCYEAWQPPDFMFSPRKHPPPLSKGGTK